MTLKKVQVPYVEQNYCEKLLRRTRLGRYFHLHASFVCAGGEANSDACYGDGGGPLVCQNPTTLRYSLVGITAWGIGCGTENVPGVYANVPYLMPWIKSVLNASAAIETSPREEAWR